MPDLADLPILRELRDDLDAAFLEAERTSPRRPVRTRRRWLLSAGGLIVAGVAATVLALTSGIDEGEVASPPATAAELLRRTAQTAREQPSLVPAPDEWFYVHSLATNLSQTEGPGPPNPHLITVHRKVWTSLTQRGRLVQRGGIALPQDSIGAQGHYFLGNEKLTRDELLAYPTDPKAIIARLTRSYVDGQGGSLDAELFVQVGDALREQPAPPALRAGLYRALADIPGVVLVGEVTDRAGRTGLAVARTDHGVRHELVLDAETSELLAERETLLAPRAAEVKLPAGTLITDTSYLERAVTRTTEVR